MSERRWDIYVRDMIECCGKVADYTAGFERDSFFATRVVYEAVLWNLAILGEAATNIPAAVRDAHPEIPWHAITGTRNRIIHGYLTIDDTTVWEIVREGIPELTPLLRALLEEAEKGDPSAT